MLEKFISDVEQMRVAQRHYFALVTRAKKTKNPADWTDVRTSLETAKHLEAKVDTSLNQLLKTKVPA